MLDDKIRSEVEQAQAAMVELWPSLWRQLFLRNIEEGFTEGQSMDLVKAYILSTNVHGSRP